MRDDYAYGLVSSSSSANSLAEIASSSPSSQDKKASSPSSTATLHTHTPSPHRLRRAGLLALGLVLVALAAFTLHPSAESQVVTLDADGVTTTSGDAASVGGSPGGRGAFADKLLGKWAASTSEGLARVFSGAAAGQAGNAQDRRITLIAMWDDDYLATYLPTLFSSARRNADAVDLLWINVMRDGDHCLDVSPFVQGASNIKVLCITKAAEKQMTRQYLCDAWNCTDEEVLQVDQHLKTRDDPIHCEFKPLRGGVYGRWVKTKWWAWIDADQIIGNFKDLWPWEVIDNFDLATVSEWDVGNIYLRGQFTAFKTPNPSSPNKIDKIWLKYPPLSSPSALSTLGHGPLDEFQYSVLYLQTLREHVDWITLPRALGADKFGKNKLVFNGKRAFYVPEDMRRRDVSMLVEERYAPKAIPAFAANQPFDPEKWAVPIRELRKGDFVNREPLSSWCDQKETRCTVMRESYWYDSTMMRYKGQLLEYFDQRATPRGPRVEIFFGIEEKLLLHFQENKRTHWFAMPPEGVKEDEIMEIRLHSVVVWNKYTLETTFQAIAPRVNKPLTPNDELLAHGYWAVNGSEQLTLPVGVQRALYDA